MDLAWIFQFIITCVVGIIAYFLKDIRKSTEDKILQLVQGIKEFQDKTDINLKAHLEMTEKIRCELNAHKEDVGREYVRKEDYLQTTGDISKKLDKIFDILMDMRGRGN